MSFVKFIPIVLLAAATPAMAATTITFDTLPSNATVPIGTAISTQYASLGVTFSGSGPAGAGAPTATDYSGGATNTAYARNFLANFALPSSYGNSLLAARYDTLTIQFTNAASNVSFGLNTFATNNSATFKAYDANGLLLETAVLSANGGWEIRSLSATGISRIDVLAGINTNGSIKILGIDQLTFTADAVAAVPEPATWAMMIGGFGMIGGTMRRRRMRTTVTFA